MKHLCWFILLMGGYLALADETAETNYQVQGILEKIAPDGHQATIHNDNIPGYMMEMTMDFAVKDTNDLKGMAPGDKIAFTLTVTRDDSWIRNVRRVGHSSEAMTNRMAMPAMSDDTELGPGDLLPDATLIAENGREVHFQDFRGRAVAFTFFYTRCPLPNYCPRMNRNFAEARDLMLADSHGPTNWEFLSISFDPQFDTPQVLTSYGGFYRGGNPKQWLFAAASTNSLPALAAGLDLMVVRQGSALSHNLRTVLLDTHGRIFHQFDGNEWTPQDLARALGAAARQ